ncbi:unnamed protein product [Prunus armeniaca]
MEQPKKEIPVKMPGNEKPLATIIEGSWYFVGKSEKDNWNEEYEEEQLDYEPFADDQNELLEQENRKTGRRNMGKNRWSWQKQRRHQDSKQQIFGGVPIPKVMVDGGAAINLLPHRMLSKMGRTEKDLIPTRLTVTNFAGGITKTYGILDLDVIVGSKKLKIAFFVVDT